MKVYLATSGSYSDYQVLHVFTRREDAEAYELADDVEEFELHDGPVEARIWHQLSWWPDEPDGEHTVEGGFSGHTYTLTNPRPIRSYRQDFDGRPNYVEHRWDPGYHTNGKSSLIVQGWDPERIRKVYGELRAEWLSRKALGHVWDSEKCEWTPGEVDA